MLDEGGAVLLLLFVCWTRAYFFAENPSQSAGVWGARYEFADRGIGLGLASLFCRNSEAPDFCTFGGYLFRELPFVLSESIYLEAAFGASLRKASADLRLRMPVQPSRTGCGGAGVPCMFALRLLDLHAACRFIFEGR